MNRQTSYSLNAERVALILLTILAALVVVHIVAMQVNFNPAFGLKEKYGFHYWQIAFFDLDEEESFGTWFNSGLLFLSAVLLIHWARILRTQDQAWHRWWQVLGIGFCILSLDEVVGMHEWLNSMLEDTSWIWTMVGFPILVVVGLAYAPFLWHYRWRTGLLMLFAGALYGGGAVGVEHFTDSEVNSLHYNMWTALEEGMEMLGVILFIYTLLDHQRGEQKAIRLDIDAE